LPEFQDLALAVLLLAAVGCAAAGPRPAPDDPRSMVPPGIPDDWLHFTDASAEPGNPAPTFRLKTPDGRTILSPETFRGRPLVLVFGSWT